MMRPVVAWEEAPSPCEVVGGWAVILVVIPPGTTHKTGGDQADGAANVTSVNDTRRYPVDGWEPTHNWLVSDSTRWTRGCSSVGQSRRLITARSQVRGLPAPPSKTSKPRRIVARFWSRSFPWTLLCRVKVGLAFQESVELAGDVADQAASDLTVSLALGASALGVGAGGLVVAQPGQDEQMERTALSQVADQVLDRQV
jgi:hypothetical protein